MKYAELDANKCVIRVVVCDSLEWLQAHEGGTWVETSETTDTAQGAGPGLYYAGANATRKFVPPWVAPEGPDDAYAIGEWRWLNGRAWRNTVDKNTSPPDEGWE